MTTAVFCGKDLVAVHVKYITDICNPRVSKFSKETKRRYLSVQAVKLKSKGLTYMSTVGTVCTSTLQIKPSLIRTPVYIKSILLRVQKEKPLCLTQHFK